MSNLMNRNVSSDALSFVCLISLGVLLEALFDTVLEEVHQCSS